MNASPSSRPSVESCGGADSIELSPSGEPRRIALSTPAATSRLFPAPGTVLAIGAAILLSLILVFDAWAATAGHEDTLFVTIEYGQSDWVYGYIDASGRVVVRPQFTQASPFSQGLAAVQTGGRYGYIDAAGKWVIAPRFDAAGKFADGIAPVRVGGANGRYGYIDKTGSLVTQPQFDEAEELHEGMGRVTAAPPRVPVGVRECAGTVGGSPGI